MAKRSEHPTEMSGALIKRQRGETPPSTQIAISSGKDERNQLIRSVQRTSGLEAPIISLSGAHSVSELLHFATFASRAQNSAFRALQREKSLVAGSTRQVKTSLQCLPIVVSRCGVHILQIQTMDILQRCTKLPFLTCNGHSYPRSFIPCQQTSQ